MSGAGSPLGGLGSRWMEFWFKSLSATEAQQRAGKQQRKDEGLLARVLGRESLRESMTGKNEGRWTRQDVAEFLNVSPKTVQRMESKGILVRCPNLGASVRFDPRDVRRLASASVGKDD